MKPEKYVWTDDIAKITNTKIKNAFLGSEGCGIFMESGSLSDDVKYLRKNGVSVGLIIPFLTPEREKNFKRLLAGLEKKTEVAVNDMGAFCLVEKSGHTPIIGRLLTKQQTDPAICRFYIRQPERKVLSDSAKAFLRHIPPSERLERYFRDIPVFSNAASEVFLQNRNCIAVILDMPAHGLPETVPKGFEIILHKSSVITAVLPCVKCSDCPMEETYIGTTRSGVPIYRKRNICYYKPPDRFSETESEISDYINKILYSL